MKFLGMARYDEVVSIDLWLVELRGARFSCAGRICASTGVVLFESVIRFGCTGIEGRPRRIPEELSGMLQQYLASSEDHESKP